MLIKDFKPKYKTIEFVIARDKWCLLYPEDLNNICLMKWKNIVGIIDSDYLIVDPFVGSGTTGIACKELSRDFVGCDIDNDYCELAIKRIEEELNG